MWLRGPLGLVALVTLESPLFHELLSLTSKRAIVPVGELALLGIVSWPPLGADVDAAGDADLLSRLLGVRGRVLGLPTALLAPSACRNIRR